MRGGKMNRYPWRDTSSDIAGGQPPQWETPQGAQAKADKAEEESKKYTDEKNADFTSHVQNATIHVTQSDKDDWNSKAPGVHIHPNATTTTPGFMSSADKEKLDGVSIGANNYVHPTTHPPSIIAQDAGNRFVTDAEKTAWTAKAETTTATLTAKGLMSATDKSKLDGIESGAEVNQNAFATIKAPGQADLIAGSKQEVINFTGGTGITVTTDPAGKKVMITATGEATPGAHASSHITGGTDVIPDAVTSGASGLMNGTDAEFVRVIGETKTGAQAKADGAEATAKSYTDTRITELDKEVTDAAAVAAAAIPATQKGAASGVATLGSDSKVPAAQLPISTATDNTSQTQVASASAVKAVYDLANTAKDTADAALPKSGGQINGMFSVRYPSQLGQTAGSTQDIAYFSSPTTSNWTGLLIRQVRFANGPNWDTSATDIRRRTDVTDQAVLRFQGDDILFIDAAGQWTTLRYLKSIAEGIIIGTGSPEGAATAPVGSLYRRRDGFAGETLYIKESGTGNTGWRAVK
jgi:hypothetical protein